MKIAAIIVAAGRSTRFGGTSKLLADLHGIPVIQHVADAVSSAQLDDRVVIVPPERDVADALKNHAAIRTIVNPTPEQGLSSSIRAGIEALGPDIAGAVILLADMPLVAPKLIDDLRRAFEASCGNAIVFPGTPDGRQGNPVVWPRDLFSALAGLSGDKGGKSVLIANAHRHVVLPIDGAAAEQIFTDIDTPADLAALSQSSPKP